MSHIWIPLGALNALIAIACGAFGAHGLKDRLSAYHLGVFQTGAQYHLAHAMALVLFGLFVRQADAASPLPGILFSVGILLFSGSLYALALTDVKILGAITPLGGLSFMAGWLSLAWIAWKAAP